jgi:hypothetical protein
MTLQFDLALPHPNKIKAIKGPGDEIHEGSERSIAFGLLYFLLDND